MLKTKPEWRGEGCAKACINNLAFHMESIGIVPYGGLSGLEILEQLKQGYRLEKPRDTSRDL